MLHLITGGAGFVGSHLVDALISRGDEVVIADNLSTGSLRNIAEATKTGRATFLFCDVSGTTDELASALEPVVGDRRLDRIFHLASPASPDAYGEHPWETLLVNGLGTMSLLKLAERHQARFIYSSTSEIYGDPLVHPQPESYFGNVDPIGPRACYDEGKRFGEAAVSVAVSKYGIDGRLVRFFNCYGPRMSPADGRLIPALAEAIDLGRPFPIHGNGMQTRSMTYIADAIELLLLVAEAPPSDTLRPVNIGNDREETILAIAEVFARVCEVPFRVEHTSPRIGDPQRRRPDLTYARSLGWEPRVSLEEGLARTLEWTRQSAHEFA